jgi:hypothetical protein
MHTFTYILVLLRQGREQTLVNVWIFGFYGAERGTMGPCKEPSMIRIRAHTLLCIQGFRGAGYSPEFVDNLSKIHETLFGDPQTWVEIVDTTDAVCGACPHGQPAGCTLNGPMSEQEMRGQDRHVLTRLGLKAGTRIQWREILNRIRTSTITGENLPDICGQCRWLPLGYCREGIDRLRQEPAPEAEAPRARTATNNS